MAENESDSKKLKFKVFVRLRPAANDSGIGPNGVCKTEHRIITIHDPAKEHSSEFVFDRVFGSDSSQDSIFQEIGKPLVEHAMQGYNACCFAYGQTSSGKTFTMFGKETGEQELRGIIPRSIENLFQVATEVAAGSPTRYAFFVSFLEIYLEQVRDLGRAALMSKESGGKVGRREMEEWARSNLDVMEDSSGQTSVKDLTYIEVSTAEEVLSVLKEGAALRTTASTALNDVSSRSHTVFTISVVQYRDGNKPVTGRLHLVDLAGSERQSKTNSEGQRLTEAKAINKSLTALGKVVMTLSQGEKQHVPFRDSKLTRILKDSLQGNSLTSMVAALNPLPDNAEECFNTLQFAVRCQLIDLAPHINVVGGPGGGAGGGGGGGGDTDTLMSQITALQEELDYTHAHYQKIIESVAGPGWTANMGPLEREPGGPSTTSAPSASNATRGDSARLNSAGAGGDMSARPGGSISRPQTAGKDALTRRMEMQLESTKAGLKESEDALFRKRLEYDDMRDRALGKERTQFTEIKKLRQQVVDLQGKLTDQSAESLHKSDEARKSYDLEVARLQKDSELLRAQLAQLSGSLSGIMEARSNKATADGRIREHAKHEADRQASQTIAAIAAEKERQVENLKQQSSYFLRTKVDEAGRLAAELLALQKQSAEETAALQAECDHVAAYAERVTTLLRHMESGVYATVERPGGLRSFRLPQRDRPAALDPARLGYLKQAGDQAARLLEATAAAAAGPPPSLQGGGGGGSGAGTAGGYSQTVSQEVSLNRSVVSLLGEGGEAEGQRERGAAELGPELEALRNQWEEETKGASQVSVDLRDERTAEYVRTLEAAVGRYRAELQQEKRRQNEMVVALRSAQRAVARPSSPLNSVMQHPSLAEPQKWGYGHTTSPYNGGTTGGTASRPMTAAGRLNGTAMANSMSFGAAGLGFGAAGLTGGLAATGSRANYPGKNWSRPSTATGMQMLTAGYRDNGVQF